MEKIKVDPENVEEYLEFVMDQEFKYGEVGDWMKEASENEPPVNVEWEKLTELWR